MAGRLRAGGAAATAAVALCVLAAPTASAGPRPGERYDGRSATGQRIYLSVRADGRRLHRYGFVVRTRCSDGKRRPQGLLHPGERPVRIDAAGHFAYRSAAQRGSYRTRPGRVRGLLRLSFEGTFDGPGDSATGTIRATFRSGRFDCSSGPVAFTVYRDGTAGAPWRDPVMATGLYAAQARGVAVRLRVLAPGRVLLPGTVINYRAPCRSGDELRAFVRFKGYEISDDGRMSIPGRGSFRDEADDITVRARSRLEVTFSDGTSMSGVWRVRAVLFRGGRAIDTCRMRRSFAGSFQRGPV
jgi:hypothetical protein